MTLEDRILRLLETMMETGCSAEDVCAEYPDLLPEVRARWKILKDVASQIEQLFPEEDSPKAPDEPEAISSAPTLPEIPGYRVESVLGRGGMGVVYKARHLKLGRAVALKMLVSGIYAGPDERTRFMREAKAIAGLRHPHIIQVYDIGELNGCPYFTMEFLEGGNLSQKQAGNPQPMREAASLLALLAGAMHLAHQSGVVHRDLKPSNILLTDDGIPKITDFGLARRLDADDGVTQPGVRVGTPSYMAPEQALGTAHAIGPAADIYALGAILYELLTGRPPFHGATSSETLSQLLLHDPVPPARLIPRMPRDLDTICLKCLQKLPERRYLSSAELAVDLERFLRGEPIQARPVGMTERLILWTARHKAVAVLLAAVFGLLLALAAGATAAAAHFRQMEVAQHGLATEKTQLAADEKRERISAVEAEAREAALRKQAENQGEEIRRNLYFAQMNLAGQAAKSPSGIGRVRDRLAPWENERPDLRGWEWYYLEGLCHRDRLTLEGHTDAVLHVAWSPDGRRLASSSSDGTVKLWDAADGQRLVNIKAHNAPVYTVAWSPNGLRLATAAWDGTVKTWNAVTGSPLYTFRSHGRTAYAVAWSPDGAMLASGDSGGVILVWDAATGKVRSELHGHRGTVYSLVWTNDGKQLASGSEDSSVRLWNVAAGKEIATLPGHFNWVRQVAWNGDCTRLASASNDGLVKIWDVNARKELLTLHCSTQAVCAVAWSPDNTQLATGSDDQTVRLWNATNGAEVVTLRGHTFAVNSVAWSPDGTRLASGSGDDTVKLWDAPTAAETPTLVGHTGSITSLSWSPDHTRLASASRDGTARIWDVSTHREEAATPIHPDGLTSVAWSPNGRKVACAGQQQGIEIWNVNDHSKFLTLRGHPAREVHCLAWSPDSRVLASAGADGTIRTWNAVTGDELHTFVGHQGEVRAVAWSPDGLRLASAGIDCCVKVWNAATGAPVLSVHPHWSTIRSVRWSPDGRWLASASSDQTIAILSASTGATALTLRGHTSGIIDVVWSPDSTRLASAGEDQTVKIWDAVTGSETLTLGNDPNGFTSLAWSPDGMVLAVGDADQRISLYDATAGYLAARRSASMTR